MNYGVRRVKLIHQVFVGFSLGEFTVTFHCFSTVGFFLPWVFKNSSDSNMNRLIQICSNLASWNPAGKLPLTTPSLIPSALFFQLQLQTEPSAPAPQRLGSHV